MKASAGHGARPSPTLMLTRPLLHWLRRDPAWQRQPVALRARLAWLANLGSLNLRLGEALEPDAESATPLADPVFVVGPWRSGTTVMHELLVAASGCAAPRTWQCMNAAAFRLGPPPAGGVAAARPMDGLTVQALSPQEDEFALLTVGVESAYRAFWMPHRIGELHHTVDPAYWQADTGWLAPWTRLLAAMQARQPEGTQAPLILKSPNHTWRLPTILQRFPNARLVWMARDPAQVLASNLAMWRTMGGLHGLTPVDPALLAGFLDHALAQAAAVLRQLTAMLPPSQLVLLTHDQLRADPAAATTACLQRLALPCEELALAAALQRVASGRIEPHADMAASAAVRALQATQTAAVGSHGRHAH